MFNTGSSFSVRPARLDLFTFFAAKDRLYNAIIDEMVVDGAEFPVTWSSEMVSREMMVLTDSLWLIDGNHQKIQKRASVQIPQRCVCEC